MIENLTLILLCQLLGELIVGALGVQIPGPVAGMVFLLCLLFCFNGLPTKLTRTTDSLLQSMSLLFVPAGTGIMMHFNLLGDVFVPLGLALIFSTTVTIVVTALLMQWLNRISDP